MDHPNRINYSDCAFWSFALTVALLPVGLGGDRPIPVGLAQAGLSLSLLFMILSPDIWQNTHFFTRLRWALGLVAVVLTWTLFQAQPLVPASWMHPLWQEAASVLNKPVYGSISIVPEDSFKGILRLITYIAGGLLAYALTQDPRRARQLVWTLWVSGTVICIYGLMIQITGLNMILWFRKWSYVGDLTATFVNRNHFAIYAGMILVCGVGLLLQSWREAVESCRPHQRIGVIRSWFIKQGLLHSFLLLLVLISIILSHSRAGLVLSLIGLSCFLFFYQIYLRAWRRAWIIGIIMLVVFMVAMAIAVNVSDRFAILFVDYSSADRSKVYDLSWRILLDNPWLGYGINGFEPEYRLYQQNMLEEFNHVHSDVLESLIDLGLPFGLLLWLAIGVMCSGLWHGVMHRRQNGLYPTLALAASVMALGHALVDFDLQIPGVTLTWTALLGTGLAQSWSRSKKRTTALA